MGKERLNQEGPAQMATYAIGDIQGCFATLEKLLSHINFDDKQDTLWFTGDLVNRGPQSLETLRFVKELGNQHRTVLGNHDLHLLAVLCGAHPGWEEDTFEAIITAPDKNELIAWLSAQPLIHHDATLGYTMVHAGLSAKWNLAEAEKLAAEVSETLQSHRAKDFFIHMYGNQPDQWRDDLMGWDRLRCITNYFTRARFCYADGRLELQHKGTLQSHPEALMPWFKVPERKSADLDILFGHWAALGGITNTPRAHALDTGCIWGFDLTAMRLDDQKRFAVPCEKIPNN
jgi:bis(5'-nucleosyl)-tetraphosphatase (symmetrical)